MNKKGGMNTEELRQFFNNGILPLFPDAKDQPGHGYIANIDSGPGRRSIELAVDLHLNGILYPSPKLPNATGSSQECYGPLKFTYYHNINPCFQ